MEFFVLALSQMPDGRVGVVSLADLPEDLLVTIPPPSPDGLAGEGRVRPTPDAVAAALRRYADADR